MDLRQWSGMEHMKILVKNYQHTIFFLPEKVTRGENGYD